MNIRNYYKLAWFADLAYVDWSSGALRGAGRIDQAIRDANLEKRAPEVVATDEGIPIGPALASKIFLPAREGWTIADYHPNDADSGFAATLFTRGDGAGRESVLAIRGTEPLAQFGVDLLEADLQQIGGIGLALSQGVALVNYVQRLQAAAGTEVSQWRLVAGNQAPPAGAPA
ncbi:MAG: hypothetical protein RLW62_06145, partial [Gammaproteobacteria bacterium]